MLCPLLSYSSFTVYRALSKMIHTLPMGLRYLHSNLEPIFAACLQFALLKIRWVTSMTAYFWQGSSQTASCDTLKICRPEISQITITLILLSTLLTIDLWVKTGMACFLFILKEHSLFRLIALINALMRMQETTTIAAAQCAHSSPALIFFVRYPGIEMTTITHSCRGKLVVRHRVCNVHFALWCVQCERSALRMCHEPIEWMSMCFC